MMEQMRWGGEDKGYEALLALIAKAGLYTGSRVAESSGL